MASAGWFAALLAAAAVVAALVGTAATATATIVGLPVESLTVRYGIPLARVLLDVGVVAGVGLALLSKFLGYDRPDRTEPVMIKARRLAVWASWVWTISALVSVVLLSAQVYATSFPKRSSGFLDLVSAPVSFAQYVFSAPHLIARYVSNVPAGKGLLISAAFGLISVWLCRKAVRHGETIPAEVRVGVAVFALLPLPLTGHASDWYWHDFVMMSMELHVVSSSAWAGGLAAVIIFLITKPPLLAQALPRFSKLATYCVFVVAATGLFSGIAGLATSKVTSMPEAIWDTAYGQLLIVKFVCIALVAVTAVRVRRIMMPKIAVRQKSAVALWCGLELLVLAVAFGVAVVLTRAAPY